MSKIYDVLLNHFGAMNWWPIVVNHSPCYEHRFSHNERTREEILEISIGAILTQNTNWENVVSCIHNLKKNNILDIASLNEIGINELALLIKSSGYYNQKAKKIKSFVHFILQSLDGDLYKLKDFDKHDARTALLGVWGIGKETADCILLYGYDFTFFVIDNYCKRVFYRIGILGEDSKYQDIQSFFQENLLDNAYLYQEYHALIVKIGKVFCKTKPLCDLCVLKQLCMRRHLIDQRFSGDNVISR